MAVVKEALKELENLDSIWWFLKVYATVLLTSSTKNKPLTTRFCNSAVNEGIEPDSPDPPYTMCMDMSWNSSKPSPGVS